MWVNNWSLETFFKFYKVDTFLDQICSGIIALAWKAKYFAFAVFFPSFTPWISEILGNSDQKKYFIDHRTANKILLFVVIKWNFSGPFLF